MLARRALEEMLPTPDEGIIESEGVFEASLLTKEAFGNCALEIC